MKPTPEMIAAACEAFSKAHAIYPSGGCKIQITDWFELEAEDAVAFGVLKSPKWSLHSDIRSDEYRDFVAAVIKEPMREALTAALSVRAKYTREQINEMIGRGEMFVDTNPEADWIAASEMACPHCGGSGHKDDVREVSAALSAMPAVRVKGIDEGRFETWTLADFAGQCRMQARDNLDPEYCQFMEALAARLSAIEPAGVVKPKPLEEGHQNYNCQCAHPSQCDDSCMSAIEPDGVAPSFDLPSDVIESLLAIGTVEWGVSLSQPDEAHAADLLDTLRMTREHFGITDEVTGIHGVYLEGTGTVLAHTGMSPNSPQHARILVGAWNQLVEVAKAHRSNRKVVRHG